MLISREYASLNAQLHASRPDYGIGGRKWAREVVQLIEAMKIGSVLDYGAGKGFLGATVRLSMPGVEWNDYDPAVDAIANEPVVSDLVTCTDVLEHIEPSCLNAVLDHIQSLARKAVFLVIATRPAAKTLADGRNAHLIQQNWIWWGLKIEERWQLMEIHGSAGEVLYIGRPRNA